VFKNKVFLTQTDTTIGFVCQDADKLTTIKQRPPHKFYIKAINNLYTLKTMTRIPKIHRNRIRRSKKTTFILPNGDSYRIIRDKHHLLILNRLKWAYSTSANLSNLSYDENFAKNAADVIIEPLREKNSKASAIYKLNKNSLKKIR